MPKAHKISFLITLALLFLLPIFFIPGGALNLEVAKSILFSFGIIIAVLVFLFEVWQEEKLDIPWHPFILTVVLLPLIYALSALLSTPSSLSLLGYNFEVGTFGFTLLGSIILILVAVIFSDTSRILQALVAFFVSISIVVLFVTIKIFFGGDVLVWGNFFGNMGNPIGNWTDLAVSFGLLSAFSALALGMIPMKLSARILVYVVFVFGVAMLVIINFSTALILTVVVSIFLFLYFSKVEKHFFSTAVTLPLTSNHFFLRPTFLPIILGVISLIYLINPTISATRGTLGDVMSNAFNVVNIDVRPSFSATLGISKAVLSQDGLLGSGPNTFGQDWLVYKPVNINTTPFWAVAFPFGIGFIPTQIASTGLLGSILWIAFFVSLLLLGVLALSHMPESRDERFTLVSTLLLTVLLWVSSFLYTPSGTMLMLAFIFSGLFMAVSMKMGIITTRVINLKKSPQVYFTSILFLVMIALGTLSLGWIGFNKTVSAFYFKKAVDLSNTTGITLVEIEDNLNKAVKFAPVDMHYVALSRINFAKAQVAASATTGTTEENRALFDEALRKSIEMAKMAVSLNSVNYDNWVSLGMIYSALVPSPLSVEGAYESAQLAYSEASARNPTNPELQLLLARLELNRGDKVAARSFIRKSLALKENYADAYLLLAQLEVQEGNTALAIASAERLAILMPNNSGIYFELGLLKYSSNDYLGAVEALNLALVSTPDYANAKYYLGLALLKLSRFDEARVEFEALLLTNPDSAEVRAALEVLRKDSIPL
ncbi:MAG: tetratricopeptide repeat protein [bacterium]|nr:tetratricopeptide repeat protein [bacterium]